MKQFKILIFLLLLLPILPSKACIDDLDDWDSYEYYNDDDYDDCIDGGELDEVVCTPNHDDEETGSSLDEIEDDDEGYTWEKELEEFVVTSNYNYDNDEGWDNENQYDDEEPSYDDDDASKPIGSLDGGTDDNDKNKNKYHKRKPHEVDLKSNDINYHFPEKWKKQEIINECTFVIMEYLSNYFANTLFDNYCMDRYTFAEGFIDLFGHDGSLDRVYYSELLTLLGYEGFRYVEIELDDIISNIKANNPVMVTINDGTHEGLIIGYSDSGDDNFYVVNPSTGSFQTHNKSELTNCIAITGYQVYK